MAARKKSEQRSSDIEIATDGVEVTFYTDPLCCWSWAMAPSLSSLQEQMGPQLKIQFKMGGLLPSWEHYRDSQHSISRPSQMGPEWLHASHLSGTKLNPVVWISDPPASSYPACIAVKAAQLQSDAAGTAILRLLSRAVMVDGKNIAKRASILEVAWDVYEAMPDFDLIMFREDLLGERGKIAFRSDLQEAKYLNVNRFPTLLIQGGGRPSRMLTGFQPMEVLKAAIVGD